MLRPLPMLVVILALVLGATVPSAHAQATHPNLLTNPSFELDANTDGRADGWSGDSAFRRVQSPTAIDGAYVGRFSATRGSPSIYQRVKVTEGVPYLAEVTTNIAPQHDPTFSVKLSLSWRSASDTTIQTLATYIRWTTNGWEGTSIQMIAPDGATSVVMRVSATSLNGTIDVDALRFQVCDPTC